MFRNFVRCIPLSLAAGLVALTCGGEARAASPSPGHPTDPSAVATYYVDNSNASCSDSGSGSQAAPFCSISAALTAHHAAGTTIVVLPGIYREQVSVPTSGVSGSPIVLQAQGSPGHPVVVSGADDFASPALWVPFSGNVWLAAGVTWSPKQVFADSVRLTASTAAPATLPVNSFVWVPGEGLYVNGGGDNPGSHHAEVGHQTFGFYVSGRSWVVIDGFTATRSEQAGIEVTNLSSNVTVTHNTVTFASNYGIQAQNSTAVLIGANVCSDHLWAGIALTAGANGCTVQDNDSFHNLTPNQANGIYGFNATGNLFQRNRVHDNAYNGIMMSTGAANNVLIQNQSWQNVGQGIEDIFCTGNSHIGDVSYGNRLNGFAIEGGATGTTLSNCVAVDNGQVPGTADVEVDASSTLGFTSNDNVIWNSTIWPVVFFGGASYATVSAFSAVSGQDTRTTQADPLFTNPAGGDFRPTAGSPLIDAANSSVANWPPTDAAGNARLDDPATTNTGLGPVAFADRGALEFNPASPPPPPVTTAGTYYVNNTSGSSTSFGPGTPTKPYSSISAALAGHHAAGTTIVVMPGIYHEQITVPASGAPGSPLVIQAEDSPGNPVVVDGAEDFANPARWVQFSGDVWLAADVTWSPKQVFADSVRLAASAAEPAALPVNSFVWVTGAGLYVNVGGDNPGSHGAEVGNQTFGFYVSGHSSVVIDGFTVTRSEFAGIEVTSLSTDVTVTHNTVTFSNNYGIQAENSTAVLIGSNVCSDNLWAGIALTAGSTGCTVQDNESFHNLAPDQGNGIYGFNAAGNLFQRNRAHDNAYNGIMMSTGAVNNVLVQNRSWNNANQGIEDVFCTGNRHVGDVSYGNSWNGFAIEGGATGTALINCVAVNNGHVAGASELKVDLSSTPGFTASDNLYWNPVPGATVIRFGGATYSSVSLYKLATGKDARTLQADPRFASPAAGDFLPTAGSPLIDAANSGVVNWPSTDAAGNGRVDDLTTANTGRGPVKYADRGALEYLAPNQPPVAQLLVSPASGQAPLIVTANASGSSDPEHGRIASYRFDFGDGTVVGPQSGATATHTYTAAGRWLASVTVTDSLGATGAASAASTVSAGAVSTLAFVQQPSTSVAGTTLTPPVTVRVRDAFGNPVPGASIALALVGEGTLTGGAAVVSDSSGLAMFPGLSVNLSGSKRLTASSGAAAPVLSDPFTVSVGPAATLAFEQQPTASVAGATITPAVTLRVRDAFGNGVAGAPVTLDLVGSGTLNGGAAVASDSSGLATFPALNLDVSGNKQLTATSGALTPVSSNPFTVSAGLVATLAFEQQPSASVAGATITPTVTVRLRDAFGNAVAGAPVTLGLVDGGPLTGGATVASDSSGLATFAALSVTLSGTKQLTASSGVLTPVSSDPFTVSAGVAVALAFAQQPSVTVAGTTITPAVTVRVRDVFGNGVAGTAVALTLASSGTMRGGAAVTSDGNGLATFAGLSVDLAGTKHLTASSETLAPASSDTFTVRPAAAVAISFEQQPSATAAGSPITPAVTVRVRDEFGNRVPGMPVTLSLVGGGTLSGGTTTTDVNGLATFAGLSANLTGSKQLAASCGALTPVPSNTFTILAGAEAMIRFEQQPSATVAGATITPAVTVRVSDEFGNPVAGSTVALALVGGGTLTGNAVMATNDNGLAAFAGLSVDQSGTKMLTASTGTPATPAEDGGGKRLNTSHQRLAVVFSNPFTVSAGAAFELAFEQQPSAIVSGANITPGVTVHVRDMLGNDVVGAAVTLRLVGSGTLSGALAATSNNSGLATLTTLSVDLAGPRYLNASSGTLGPVSSSLFVVASAAITRIAPTILPEDSLESVASGPVVATRDGGANLAGNIPPGTRQGAAPAANPGVDAELGRAGGLAPTVTPNPLRTSASIGFRLERPATVGVRIFDLCGRLVRTLPVMGARPAGWNVVVLDGRAGDGAPLNSGIYLYEINAGAQHTVGRFVVMR